MRTCRSVLLLAVVLLASLPVQAEVEKLGGEATFVTRAAGTRPLRLILFDGFSECRHGTLEEQVIKNFSSTVQFQITEITVTHGVNCDQLDQSAMLTGLKQATETAKTDRVIVYVGYGIYGHVPTLDKPFGDLSKVATIVTGAGNESNDSCKQNWLAPYAVLVGSALNGSIESYSGHGACTDLYLDYGGSLTVVIDGMYYGVGGTSTSSAIVAAEALNLLAANPQATSAQLNQALSLGQRILKTVELMTSPTAEGSASRQARSVSVTGGVLGPVPSVAIYRGLPSAVGSCKGKPIATVAAKRDGSFAASIMSQGANLCLQSQPFGLARGISIQ
jgi:hypothetical protein